MTDKIEWGGTVGPWAYEVHSLSEGYSAIVYDGYDQRVADYLSEEDARAIAEVPAMVQALRKFIEQMDANGRTQPTKEEAALLDAIEPILARIDGAA